MKASTCRALICIGLALLALASWRAWPRLETHSAELPAIRVVVFDASAGTTRPRPGWGVWARRTLRDQAHDAQAASEELVLMVYGREVRRLAGGPDPADWLSLLAGRGGRTLSLDLEARGASGSELDAALAAVEEELLAAGRARRRLALFVEPDFSGPDPTARLARLERGGVEIDWQRPPAATTPDLAVVGLTPPTSPAVGEPLALRIELALAAGQSSDLRLELHIVHESLRGVRESKVAIDWPRAAPGPDGYAHFMRSLDLGATPPGSSHITVRASLVEPGSLRSMDASPENNTASCTLRAGETRLAAIVASAERLADARVWIAPSPERWPGLQWFFVTPAELPGLVGELDLLVSFDLPSAALPERHVLQLLERGGGWLHCGAWGLMKDLGSATPGASGGLNELLPLVPAPDDAPARDVVLLVDGSGSMAGEPFDHVRAALHELVLAAPPHDELRLRFFTSSVGQPIVLDTGAEALQATLERIASLRVPGGPTAILYSLEQLALQRAGRGRPALVLMLSDGRDMNAFDTAERGAAIRRAFAEQQSELRAVATGADADLPFLIELLGGTEQLVRAEHLEQLAELFQREVFAEVLREGTLEVSLVGGGEGALAADLVSSWKAARVQAPSIACYLRSEARVGAEVLWASAQFGEPLLAIQRVSGGLVAAWASAPLPGWSPAYTNADELVGPLLRYLAASSRRQLAPRLSAREGQLHLDEVPVEWPVRLEGHLRAFLGGSLVPLPAPQGGAARILFDLVHPRPGQDPRLTRSAAWPELLDELPAGAPLAVEFTAVGEPEVLAVVGFSPPAPPEFRPGGKRLAPGPWSDVGDGEGASAGRRVDPLAWVISLVGAMCLAVGGMGRWA